MDAIKKVKNGVVIDIAVSPNAGRERIKNYDQWRKRINVDMKEKPTKFKVNREVVDFFARMFRVESARVHIVNGEKNPHKSILIEGMDYEEAEKIIGRYLEKS